VLCCAAAISAGKHCLFLSSSTQHKRKIAGCQHGGVSWGTVLSCSSLLLPETHNISSAAKLISCSAAGAWAQFMRRLGLHQLCWHAGNIAIASTLKV
jgi:hypothetical protein